MDFSGEIFGYLAGLSTAFCFLPQTLKTLKTNNVQGLSVGSYIIWIFGIICWVIYGIYMHSIPMMIFNGISFIFTVPVLYKILQYRRGKQ